MQPIKTYEKDYYTYMDFTIEMNLDQKVIARTGYTYLDFFSDIGGLQAMMISMIMYFMALWNYNYFDNHMVTRLYKLEK